VIRGVLFDMGGTVLHYPTHGDGSWRDWEAAGLREVYRALAAHRGPLACAEAQFIDTAFAWLECAWPAALRGDAAPTAADWLRQQCASLGVSPPPDATLVEWYTSPLRHGVRATDGAHTALDALRRHGLRLGLVSNTIWPAAVHRADLAALGLLDAFAVTSFSSSLGVWKPQPAIMQLTLDALGLPATDVLFVGDHPTEDIAAAQALGMRTAWCRNEQFPLPATVRPDAIIASLAALPALVGAWCAPAH
jgi:putative hydrolase of the HAD superfamily